jgi:cytoskeletal protein CcmA (bactofilin family)
MSSLRSSRNVSNLQVGNLRYSLTDVPPTGGLIFVGADGAATLTNDIQLASLDVVGAITAGTTITTPYLNVEDNAYIDNNLVVNQNITAGSLSVAFDISVNNLTVQNTVTTTNIVANNGTISTLTVGTLYATTVDASGYSIGDDLDLSGNLNVQGVANFEDAVTIEGTLDVSGNVEIDGTMTVYDLVVDTPIDELTVDKLRAYRQIVAAAGTTASYMDPSGLLTVVADVNAANQSLYVQNVSAGTSARADVTVVSGPGSLAIGVGSVANTAGPDIGSSGSATIHTGANTVGGLAIASRGTTQGHIRLYTSNGGTVGERVRVAENGAVGIATATPASALQVVVAGTTVLSGIAVNAGDVNTLLTTYNNGTTMVGALQATRLGSAGVIGSAPEALVVQPLGGDVVVGNPAEEFVLAVNYTTGIGGTPTLAVPECLQVLGDVLVRPGALLVGGGVTTAYVTLNNAYSDNGSPQTLTISMDSSAMFNSDAVIGTTAAGVATVPDIIFQLGPIEAARVTKTGRVGIATSAPAATLDVSGSILGRGGLRILTGAAQAAGSAAGTTIAGGYVDTNALRIFGDQSTGATLGPLTLPVGSGAPDGAALVWNNATLGGGSGNAQLVVGTGNGGAGKFNVYTGITQNPVPAGILPQMSLDAAGSLTVSQDMNVSRYLNVSNSAFLNTNLKVGTFNNSLFTETLTVGGNALLRTGAGILDANATATTLTLNNANGSSGSPQTLTLTMGAAPLFTADAVINTTAAGVAAVPDIVFQTGGAERMRIDSATGTVNVSGTLTAANAIISSGLTVQNAVVTNNFTMPLNATINYIGASNILLYTFLPLVFGIQTDAGGQQTLYYPPLYYTGNSTVPLIADNAGAITGTWGTFITSITIVSRVQITFYDNSVIPLGTYTNTGFGSTPIIMPIGPFTATYYSTVFV